MSVTLPTTGPCPLLMADRVGQVCSIVSDFREPAAAKHCHGWEVGGVGVRDDRRQFHHLEAETNGQSHRFGHVAAPPVAISEDVPDLPYLVCEAAVVPTCADNALPARRADAPVDGLATLLVVLDALQNRYSLFIGRDRNAVDTVNSLASLASEIRAFRSVTVRPRSTGKEGNGGRTGHSTNHKVRGMTDRGAGSPRNGSAYRAVTCPPP